MKPKVNTILFPSSYFSVRKVDEDLQSEFDAVNDTGLFEIVLFSYDKWFHEQKLILNRSVKNPCTAIYRGWMMKPEIYRHFYDSLQSVQIRLINAPQEYECFHIFPNIYHQIAEDTAKMLIFPDGTEININEVKQHFSKFMVKDYVKSVKGTAFPKYFDASVTQEEFEEQMKLFYQYRGKLYTGGICIKDYLPLKRYGDKTNEYRVFYINHEIASVSRNSGQGIDAPLPPKHLLEKYQNLASLYYTIDYAELIDGTWKILEAGDGQVSGLSDNQDYSAYFRALYQCLNG